MFPTILIRFQTYYFKVYAHNKMLYEISVLKMKWTKLRKQNSSLNALINLVTKHFKFALQISLKLHHLLLVHPRRTEWVRGQVLRASDDSLWGGRVEGQSWLTREISIQISVHRIHEQNLSSQHRWGIWHRLSRYVVIIWQCFCSWR